MLAQTEQARADGLAEMIEEIQANPSCALHRSLPHYQAAYRDAAGNAARHGEQPR